MFKRKNIIILTGLVLSVSLLSSSFTALFLSKKYNHVYTQALGQICQNVIENLDNGPEAEQAVLTALKEYKDNPAKADSAWENLFLPYGYRQTDFLRSAGTYGRFFALAGFAAGGILFLATFFFWHRKEAGRVQALTDYLEKVNTGGSGVLFQVREDEFSKLQDEIYKTVTALHQAKDAALEAKNNFAENLSNIAHQIKTPITSISLSAQMMREDMSPGHTEQAADEALILEHREPVEDEVLILEHREPVEDEVLILEHREQAEDEALILEHTEQAEDEALILEHTEQTADHASVPEKTKKAVNDDSASRHLERIMRQVKRLTHLEESLLLLSRIDAGTLMLEKKEIDVFTLLVLSADNLQELSRKAKVSMDIPETGEVMICADMEWTMEAVMNLMKNCMEHTPSGGTVHCSYEQNLLYAQIRIWDNGAGFAREDIPHLFERFYRGKDAKNGGIGIGLALCKSIIERQNGTIAARNLPAGGACFEIRFYSH